MRNNSMFANIQSIWSIAAGQRRTYLAAVAALVLASCFLYLVPLIPQATIDGVIVNSPDSSVLVRFVVTAMGGAEFVSNNLWWPALLIVLTTLLAGVFTYLRGRWANQAAERIVRRLRDQVYDHLQHLPSVYFDEAETGDLIQRCTSDVETVRKFLAMQVVEVGRAIVMMIVPIPLMLMIDVRMTLASMVMAPFIVFFALVYFGRIRGIFKDVDEAEGRMTATIQENLTGIRVVRAFARQAFEQEKFERRNREHRDLDYRLYKAVAWYWSISDLMCFLQRALVISLGAYWLAIGQLQVGAYFYFLTAVTMFIWPLRMMGRILADFGKALVAHGRIREILQVPREVSVVNSASMGEGTLPTWRGAVEFENVSFAYKDAAPAIRDVSFSLEPGSTLALLGPSGCGKSTIVALLLRLYDHQSGSIRIDGRDIRSLDRKLVRGLIASVMQEPFLYSKPLRDNIRIGRPGAVDEEVVEATSIASVHHSIQQFEDGYDTLVGERGVTLSGGQRQRVALARALMQEPAILVLDDALSAVDTETETAIIEALQRRHRKHSTIVIAHRLSTLMHADSILVLQEGRVVQVGTHTSLVEQPGLYRDLWDIQSHGGHDTPKVGAEVQ